MIAIISADSMIQNESFIVNHLFENGLQFFHVRKNGCNTVETAAFISKITQGFRNRLVLHTHHELAEEFGIHRLHIKEEKRKMGNVHVNLEYTQCVRSTSVHSIEEFNELDCTWTYAFLSPIFPSISKPGYKSKTNILESIRLRRDNGVQLVGLGGIYEDNAHKVYEAGADGIALLGGIWCASNPLQTFLRCKTKDQ